MLRRMVGENGEDLLGTQGAHKRRVAARELAVLAVLTARIALTRVERVVKEAVEVRKGIERLVEEARKRHCI